MQDEIRSFLESPHGNFIGGKWGAPLEREEIPVKNPATEEVLAKVVSGDQGDVDAAVSAARQAFQSGQWSGLSPVARAKILSKWADLVEQHADRLGYIETLEAGMPHWLSTVTIRGFVAQHIRYNAEWANKITGETLPGRPSGREDSDWLVATLKEPIGVVAAITPWNAPLSILVLKLAPALAAGCTVVLKPSELTPLSAEYFVRLGQEAGIPDGVINLVQGYGPVVGQALAEHDGIDKISFTGSTAVGQKIIHAAAGNLKKVSLELGGKSPFIVFPDADIDAAVTGAGMGCFYLTGQNCMAATRAFVHKDIADAFLAKLVAFADSLKIGNGLEEGTFLGPVINDTQHAKVLEFIRKGVDEGATLLCGGKALDGPGYWVQPTVFADATPDMSIVRKEIFGPVLSVQTFDDDLDALVRNVNDNDYALSGSVWTKDIQRALSLAKKIDAGQMAINAHAAVSPETPFGGNKRSGWGREFGQDGIEAYYKKKAISIAL